MTNPEPFLLKHISAKDLGHLAMPDFCPRCFWIKSRLGSKRPWSSFPSIFTHIDGYSKEINKSHLKAKGHNFPWLTPFGQLTNPIPCPHWSKFSFTDPTTGVALRGTPDEMFRLPDNTLAILDNKTAKFTEHEDELLPLYVIQLSSYRWIAQKTNLGEVSVTGLIYYEPDTKEPSVDKVTETGFSMSFTAHILPIQTDLAKVESLLAEAKRIAQLPTIPNGIDKCKDCEVVDRIRIMF